MNPTTSVYSASNQKEVTSQIAFPKVLESPIREDVVRFVHTNMRKNQRQAYAVKFDAGMDTAAESWGTGRAVSRIPRVPGGGTHRAGQGAFGNMCRGGRMFAPNRVWRKWHRRVNKNQRRYATASALAASAIPALVMARGHRIGEVPEFPLVLNGINVDKTSEARAILTRFGLDDEVTKCKASRKVRAGQGKMRNRRFVQRLGPLIVHAGEDDKLEKAFRNIAGVEIAHVDRLNLLKLAPGGHLGRLIVWTDVAYSKLDTIYGSDSVASSKVGYSLPQHIIKNGDISRVINSDEVQGVVRPAKLPNPKTLRKKNPLTNLGVMVKLNPYAVTHKRAEIKAQAVRKANKKALIAAKRKAGNTRQARMAFYNQMLAE